MSRFSGALKAEESFRKWEEEKRQKRNQYWSMLRRAKEDYLKLTEQFDIDHDMDPGAFYYYLQQNYGLKIEIIDGRIAGEYAILNEKKYTMFLLKYGS